MFKLVAAVCCSLIAILAGCASAPPQGTADAPIPEEAPSVDEESYEELFLDLHAEIVNKLKAYGNGRRGTIALIEAESMVSIAEEIYLEGNVPLAVHLLREAAILLRQTP